MTDETGAAFRDADPALSSAIEGRRTINIFLDTPVPDALVEAAVAQARFAPNHRLTEPWRFFLLGEQARGGVIDLMVDIAVAAKGEGVAVQRRRRLEAVPGWLALTSTRADDPVVHQENYAACCCAAQNLMLHLWQCGVGTKWTSGAVIRDPRFGDLLGVDIEAHPVVGLFWYGVPKLVPPVQQRTDTDAILHRLP